MGPHVRISAEDCPTVALKFNPHAVRRGDFAYVTIPGASENDDGNPGAKRGAATCCPLFWLLFWGARKVTPVDGQILPMGWELSWAMRRSVMMELEIRKPLGVRRQFPFSVREV